MLSVRCTASSRAALAARALRRRLRDRRI